MIIPFLFVSVHSSISIEAPAARLLPLDLPLLSRSGESECPVGRRRDRRAALLWRPQGPRTRAPSCGVEQAVADGGRDVVRSVLSARAALGRPRGSPWGVRSPRLGFPPSEHASEMRISRRQCEPSPSEFALCVCVRASMATEEIAHKSVHQTRRDRVRQPLRPRTITETATKPTARYLSPAQTACRSPPLPRHKPKAA